MNLTIQNLVMDNREIVWCETCQMLADGDSDCMCTNPGKTYTPKSEELL